MSEFTWNGGAAAFDTPSQWTDLTDPGETGSAYPQAGDDAIFLVDGDVSGSGTVTYLVVEAATTVGFTASLNSTYILDDGAITINSGGLFTDTGEVQVTGTMALQAGATLAAASAGSGIANIVLDEGGLLTVAGGSALVTTVGGLVVAENSTGTLALASGAVANLSASLGSQSSLEIGQFAGSDGTVDLASGATLSAAAGGVIVGYEGNGTLLMSGATATVLSEDTISSSIDIGRFAGSTGVVLMTAHATLATTGAIELGGGGSGTLSISGGSSVSATSSNPATIAAIVIGGPDGGTGTVTVSDAGSQLVVASGELSLGNNGTGDIVIQNRGLLQVDDTSVGLDIASDDGSAGTLSVSGSGSRLFGQGGLQLGDAGDGTLYALAAAQATIDLDLQIALQDGSTGAATIDNALALVYGAVIVGEAGDGSLTVQDNGTLHSNGGTISSDDGTGTATITSGTWTVFDTLDIAMTADSDGTVMVTGSSADLEVGGPMTVGDGGDGTLTIAQGGFVAATTLVVAAQSGSGTDSDPTLVSIGGTNSTLYIARDGTIDTATGTFTDGSWSYAASGTGSLSVMAGGYLAIGQTLTLLSPNDPNAPPILSIATGGAAEIGGNTTSTANQLLVDSGGLIIGHGTIGSDQTGMIPVGNTTVPTYSLTIADNGTIQAQQGTLVVDADVTGTGSFEIDQNATLELAGSFDATGTVNFAGMAPGSLVLDNPLGFAGSLTGLAIGDQVILQNTSNANGDGVVAATIGTLYGTQTLQVLEGASYDPSQASGTLDLPIQGATQDGTLTGDYFQVTQGSGGAATTLTLMQGNPVAISIDANVAQTLYGVTGAGLTVGVISDSFNALGGEAADIAAGALPADVTILSDTAGSDEGRAMAQIIHDIAPGAAIDFYAGGPSPATMANAITALQHAGCEIIVDDLGYGQAAEIPGGTIDQAIDTAVDDGITYVTAAGNDRTAGTPIYGHSADPDALTVAAMNLLATPASVSSVGGYITPAQTEPFSSTGTVSTKPDITGPDGDPDTFPLFLQSNLAPFFGTSAAAPAVAAVAALMMQQSPILDDEPHEVDQILEASATPFGEPANFMGTGLVNAEAAVASAAAVCYLRGTRICTARGEVAVEDLAIGELLITRTGEARRLHWIGRRSYSGRFAAGNADIVPVVIRAGAIAEGIPKRDLRVSPRHAMYLANSLIPAQSLINGATILQERRCPDLEYYHLELGSHDVILAEGAMSESYLDLDNRRIFHNASEYTALYPDRQPGQAQDYAPRLEQGPAVVDVRKCLAERAATLGYCLPSHQVIAIQTHGLTCAVVPPGVSELHLQSAARFAPGDRRRLGALILGIKLDGRPIELADPGCFRGFHAVERHGRSDVRWTNGEAMITVAPAQAERRIEIEVGAVITQRLAA